MLYKGVCAVLLVVVLAYTFTPGEAITCYQCNSEYDPRCGNPFDSYSLGQVNCSLKKPLEHMPGIEATLCRKTVQKVYGKIRIVRECGYIRDEERDDKACVRRSGTHDVFAWYCSCTTDLCNKAAMTPANQFIIVAATIVSLVVGAVVRL